LDKAELARGEDLLNALGVSAGTPWVCLAVRDSAYLTRAYPNRDWSYHDYRDSTIDHYRDLSEYLAGQGFAVFRMGRHVAHRLQSDNPLVIDYATSNLRSDVGDIYLLSQCRFCITNSTGMDSVALAFRRPLGIVNLPNVGGLRLGQTTKLVILKDLIDVEANVAVPLGDPRRLEAMSYYRSDTFSDKGYELRENTPAELLQFGVEMLSLLDDTWRPARGQEQWERDWLRAVDWRYDRSLASLHFGRDWLERRVDM
jgi:putative glycosyltransferase (TIGR04372 family)